jgi:hypothetical protein
LESLQRRSGGYKQYLPVARLMYRIGEPNTWRISTTARSGTGSRDGEERVKGLTAAYSPAASCS